MKMCERQKKEDTQKEPHKEDSDSSHISHTQHTHNTYIIYTYVRSNSIEK